MSSRQEVFEHLAHEPGRYDSHLPVLWALGDTVPLRTVVEFGPGFGSTPTWLDRATFPYLERLISYEDDAVWYERFHSEEMPARVREDPRWDLRMVTLGRMCFEAPHPPDTDLAFLDAAMADSRVALMMTLRSHVPFVLLHDYDGPAAYRQATDMWPYRAVYDRLTPSTILLSATPIAGAFIEALARWST